MAKQLADQLCPAHSGLEKGLKEVERRLNAGTDKMDAIQITVDHIKEQLLGRPGWLVCGIITGLFGALTCALTLLIPRL